MNLNGVVGLPYVRKPTQYMLCYTPPNRYAHTVYPFSAAHLA